MRVVMTADALRLTTRQCSFKTLLCQSRARMGLNCVGISCWSLYRSRLFYVDTAPLISSMGKSSIPSKTCSISMPRSVALRLGVCAKSTSVRIRASRSICLECTTQEAHCLVIVLVVDFNDSLRLLVRRVSQQTSTRDLACRKRTGLPFCTDQGGDSL